VNRARVNRPLGINAPEVPNMSSANIDTVFAGSIPKLYDTYLVPLIFEPYAEDLATRLKARRLSRVLEIAAGTGS
jgi:hypothetical protein